jgi:glutamate formiminotransferase/glutamate formiminotransferase/formiminotetrahydrofolate cyclodeaminase
VFECVVNVSEGRRADVIRAVAAAAGPCLLDVHSDPHHNRSVLTLGGSGADVQEAARAVAAAGVALIDLRVHVGVHPRLGAVDVVPFVALGSGVGSALALRDAFAEWAASSLDVPCFLYGPERSLPDVRRMAFHSLAPDFGPSSPHVGAGAMAVGARPVLVAYNVWLADGVPTARAQKVARTLRGPALRALGFDVGGRAQVSCNLLAPLEVGPAAVYDAVAAAAPVAGAELVGLAPAAVVEAVDPARWVDLDLSMDRTIEARLGR